MRHLSPPCSDLGMAFLDTGSTRVTWSASAPGKVILFGEHAVVHGRTALAASIDLRTTALVKLIPYDSSDGGKGSLALDIPSLGVHCKWQLSEIVSAVQAAQAESGPVLPGEALSGPVPSAGASAKDFDNPRERTAGSGSGDQVAPGQVSSGQAVSRGTSARGADSRTTPARVRSTAGSFGREWTSREAFSREAQQVAPGEVLSGEAPRWGLLPPRTSSEREVGPTCVRSCSEELLARLRPLAERQLAPGGTPSMAAGVTAFLFLHSQILGAQPAAVHVSTELPVGAGLGSSAAFCTALSAALLATAGALEPLPAGVAAARSPPTPCPAAGGGSASGDVAGGDVAARAAAADGREGGSEGAEVPGGTLVLGEGELALVNAWAYEGEKILHGKPSGVDNNVSTYGRVLRFQQGVIQRLAPPRPLPLRVLLSNTRVARDTRSLVRAVGERALHHPAAMEAVFTAMDCLAQEAIALLQPMADSEGAVSANAEAAAARGAVGEAVSEGFGSGVAAAKPKPELVGQAREAAMGGGLEPGLGLGSGLDLESGSGLVSRSVSREEESRGDGAEAANGDWNGMGNARSVELTNGPRGAHLTAATNGNEKAGRFQDATSSSVSRGGEERPSSREGARGERDATSPTSGRGLPPQGSPTVTVGGPAADHSGPSRNADSSASCRCPTGNEAENGQNGCQDGQPPQSGDGPRNPKGRESGQACGTNPSPKLSHGELPSEAATLAGDIREQSSKPRNDTAVGAYSPRERQPNPWEVHRRLEELVQMSQGLLEALGVSHPSIAAICQITARHGLASKLTGAGGGGCVLTLLPPDLESSQVASIKDAVVAGGYDCFEATVGGEGVQIKMQKQQETPH